MEVINFLLMGAVFIGLKHYITPYSNGSRTFSSENFLGALYHTISHYPRTKAQIFIIPPGLVVESTHLGAFAAKMVD